MIVTWPRGRSRDGGIDTVPLPVPTGGVSLCGKHAIAPDPIAAMHRCGATTVVCLVEAHELSGHWPHYVTWLENHRDTGAVWFPIHDLHAPPLDRAAPFLDGLVERLRDGEHLLIHCAAGMGRAGTIAACLLVRMGMDVESGLALVRASRPGAGPEAGSQLDLVRAIAASAGTP
jgi:ADP-ribosyl-[dinitrogen reductase] hydrolase